MKYPQETRGQTLSVQFRPKEVFAARSFRKNQSEEKWRWVRPYRGPLSRDGQALGEPAGSGADRAT